MMDGLSLLPIKDEKELCNMTLKEIIEYVILIYSIEEYEDYNESDDEVNRRVKLNIEVCKLINIGYNPSIYEDYYNSDDDDDTFSSYVHSIYKSIIIDIKDLIDGNDTAYSID